MVRPEPTSGSELTNRLVEYRTRQKMDDKQQSEEEARSEVFILCGVVTGTFKVLSLFVVTKCYSCVTTNCSSACPCVCECPCVSVCVRVSVCYKNGNFWEILRSAHPSK
jgi:hypothetical protein